MRARFIKQTGMRGKLRVYWDIVQCTGVRQCDTCPSGHPDTTYLNTCPNTYGTGKPGIHNAYTPIGDKLGVTEDFRVFGETKDYPVEKWPLQCADCGTLVPLGVEAKPTKAGESGLYIVRQVFASRLYDSPSGEPEPGDIFRLHYHDPGECSNWDNCDGMHVYGMLPNGYQWDMDARASNCTLPKDKTHRCWIRTGTPEAGNLDVGKAGPTCAAGAGSIDAPGWHGFLRNGEWQKC